MNRPDIPAEAAVRWPATWKYLACAAVAYPLLLFSWIVFDVTVWHPELMNVGMETTMDKMRWLVVPLVAVALVVGGSWVSAFVEAEARERVWLKKTRELAALEAAQRGERERREYVLEVIGLGVTVEKYRQEKLWEALQTGSPFTSIREPDPKKYPWAAFDKIGTSGGRACDALENGAGPSPMFFGVPTFYAGPVIADPDWQPSAIRPIAGLAASAESTGMAWHLFVTAPWELGEHPDRLLEQVFSFFDQYPDLPYVVLLAGDSTSKRDSTLPLGAPSLVKDGYYIPDMPDATAVFVLARRERVEPLRPYVWGDRNNDYLQENLRWMYYDVMEAVPTPEKLADPKSEKSHIGRQPTVAE